MMNAYDKIRLIKCAPLIKASLVPKYVLTNLLGEDILDEEDFKDVLMAKGREKQVQKLLDILPEKGPQAFRKFVRTLEQDYDWLAEGISCMDVTDQELESFFASKSGPQKCIEREEPSFRQPEEERGIDVQDSVPMRLSSQIQQRTPATPAPPINKEITYDMLTMLRRNSRVVKNWRCLAHRLGLSTQANSIHMSVQVRGENHDLAIVYLMEEWKGIKPDEYNLEKLVGLLREEQFNDVADQLEATYG